MTYNTEYAVLKVKTEVVEHILCQIECKNEEITRYKGYMVDEPESKFYKEQVHNAEKEIIAYEALMKLLAK